MNEENNNKKVPGMMKYVFGIIMIFIYVTMGILVLCGYFSWLNEWLRWAGGIMFITYGIWRAYRYIKGVDSRF
ncbi:MAG: hypothetical protein UH853_03925 [Muribaculaceae bacterium]|jgi:cytochrome c biogenesis protein CcdA|nr:hypothetical protein [Muribaculaceae bacterium]MEE0974843.1 hypothetical protein [Muribaculaceae bacterium]